MAIHVLRAAKHVGNISGWSLSHLRVQKLLYIAHMFHLGKNENRPLVEGNFEAWDYGPVHPVLYHKAKIFGSGPVKNIFRAYDDLNEGDEKYFLDTIYSSLKDFSGAQLVAITHREGGAWAKHYAPGARGVVIPDDDIAEEFQSIWKPEQQ